ncbi:MAG: GTP-binding protein [Chloroflexi bacterium]|nr:MAG: GTP-binding protein [Chloroflexota bacterium]
MEKNNSFQMKICVVGTFAVGKSSLVRRFVENRFDSHYVNTIGATIRQKKLIWDGLSINMNIWDMEDNTDVMHSSYLWEANAFLAVCDLSRLQTIPFLWSNIRQLQIHYPNVPVIVAGNKVDLVKQPRLPLPDDLQESVEAVVLTSAKTGENVYRLFSLMANKMVAPAAVSVY